MTHEGPPQNPPEGGEKTPLKAEQLPVQAELVVVEQLGERPEDAREKARVKENLDGHAERARQEEQAHAHEPASHHGEGHGHGHAATPRERVRDAFDYVGWYAGSSASERAFIRGSILSGGGAAAAAVGAAGAAGIGYFGIPAATAAAGWLAGTAFPIAGGIFALLTSVIWLPALVDRIAHFVNGTKPAKGGGGGGGHGGGGGGHGHGGGHH
jgi:hypothetical protein